MEARVGIIAVTTLDFQTGEAVSKLSCSDDSKMQRGSLKGKVVKESMTGSKSIGNPGIVVGSLIRAEKPFITADSNNQHV